MTRITSDDPRKFELRFFEPYDIATFDVTSYRNDDDGGDQPRIRPRGSSGGRKSRVRHLSGPTELCDAPTVGEEGL